MEANNLNNQIYISILFFGQPRDYNGGYGVKLHNSQIVSLAQVRDAAKNFILGFWQCTPANGPQIRVAIGTSNEDGNVASMYGHGAAWASMVNEVASWASPYASQISVSAASDIELGWSTPTRAREWIAGYDSTNNKTYYDFGDAAGCYPYNPTGYPDLCGHGWTREDVRFKTFGAGPAWSIPQIYFTRNNLDPRLAGQWQKVSLFSYVNGHGQITFSGALTQSSACSDPSVILAGCHQQNGVLTNSPQEGWSQFWDKLNADSRTAQPLGWSTDMSYNLKD